MERRGETLRSRKGNIAHLLNHPVGNPGSSTENRSESERGEDVHVVSLAGVSSDSVELDGVVGRSRSVDGGSVRPVQSVLEGSLALLSRVRKREAGEKQEEKTKSAFERRKEVERSD